MSCDHTSVLPELTALGFGPSDLGGLTSDSRAVRAGDGFVALKGATFNGLDFAEAALGAGAKVVLSEVPLQKDLGQRGLYVPDLRARLPRIAREVYGPLPDQLVAVTGTNGKTSVASFLQQMWQAAGLKAASLGTLGFNLDGEWKTSAGLTSPDLLTNYRLLSEAQKSGAAHMVMEASSHGLDQGRLEGLSFRALGFTNLSRDHLDYHSDMESYFLAKAKLFRPPLSDGAAFVINRGDAYGERLVKELGLGNRGFDCGADGARVQVLGRALRPGGQRLELKIDECTAEVDLPLVGTFQAQNAMLAAGLGLASGLSIEQVLGAIPRLTGVNGRLEQVLSLANGARVFVDFAHTPEALALALKSLRPFTEGRLAVVFGAGGDRDPGKRRPMGAAARAGADRIIVTDDNPRTEDATAIRAAVLKGTGPARDIGDRRRAIREALAELGPGDLLLVAGKGHEQGQTLGDEVLPFLDAAVVREQALDLGLALQSLSIDLP